MTKMNLKNYDVAVIGCGIAGSMAAIAAASPAGPAPITRTSTERSAMGRFLLQKG